MNKLTDKQIPELCEAWLRKALAESEAERAANEKPLDEYRLYAMIDNNEECLSILQRALVNQDNSYVQGNASGVLSDHDLDIDPDSIDYKKLCRELIKANILYYQIERDRMGGDYSDEFASPPPPPVPTITALAKPEPNMCLSEALEKFLNSGKRKKTTAGNKEDYRRKVGLLIKIIGNQPCNQLTPAMLDHYQEVMEWLPKRHNTHKKYGKYTLDQLAGMTIPEGDRLGPTTLVNHFGKVKAFIKWAGLKQLLTQTGMQEVIESGQADSDKANQAYTKDELALIFNSPRYTKDTIKKGWQFWLPILALFTGARLEELCQLHLANVLEQDGIWFLDINEDQADQHLKNTKSSVRQVPLHSFLTESLRFPRYCDQLKQAGGERLWPEFKKDTNDNYGKDLTKYYSMFKKSLGFPNREKTFHSFRSTFANFFKQQGGDDYPVAREILGHKVGDITSDTYGELFVLPRRFEVVSKFDYYGIDLSHLAQSKWVV